jgi:hypothetical protein
LSLTDSIGRGLQLFPPAVGKLSGRHGVAEFALDPEAAARLWQVSLDTLAG